MVNCQKVDKPDFVEDNHSSRSFFTKRLLHPTYLDGVGTTPCKLNCGPLTWACFQWGLSCHICCQTRGELLPRRFILTDINAGGLFSVTLSLRSPWAVVNRHCVPKKSGLSSRNKGCQRLSDLLTVNVLSQNKK